MIPKARTNVRNAKIRDSSYLFQFSLDEARRRIGEECSVREMESVSLRLSLLALFRNLDLSKFHEYIKILSTTERRIITEIVKV